MGVLEELSETEKKLKREEQIESAKKSLKPFLWPFLIIAAAVAAYLFYVYVPSSYKMVAIIAILAGLFLFFSAPKEKRLARVLLVAIIAVVIIVFLPQIKIYSSEGYGAALNLFSQFKSGGVSSGLYCITNPSSAECFGASAWQTKSKQSGGGITISIDWTKAVSDNTRAFVPVSVMTSNPVILTAKCFTEKGEIDTQPSQLVFQANENTEKLVTCSGDITGKMGMRLGTDVSTNLSAPIWIGAGQSKGSFDVKSQGAYNLGISAFGNQPFSASTVLFVKLSRTADFNLTRINNFEVSTQSSLISISCPVMTGSASQLSNYEKNGVFTFPCDMTVISPPQTAEQTFISLKADYSVEAVYKSNLNMTA